MWPIRAAHCGHRETLHAQPASASPRAFLAQDGMRGESEARLPRGRRFGHHDLRQGPAACRFVAASPRRPSLGAASTIARAGSSPRQARIFAPEIATSRTTPANALADLAILHEPSTRPSRLRPALHTATIGPIHIATIGPTTAPPLRAAVRVAIPEVDECACTACVRALSAARLACNPRGLDRRSHLPVEQPRGPPDGPRRTQTQQRR